MLKKPPPPSTSCSNIKQSQFQSQLHPLEESSAKARFPFRLITQSWETLCLLLTTTPKALGLVWNAHRGYCAGLLMVLLLQSLQPLANAWFLKGVIDLLTTALTHRFSGMDQAPGILDGGLVAQLLGLLLMLGLLNLAGPLLATTTQFIQTELGEHLTLKVTLLVLTKANSFKDLTCFENPQFYNKLQQVQSEASQKPLNMLQGVALQLRNGVTLVSVIGLLLALQPLLIGLLLGLSLPALLAQFRQQRQRWTIRNAQTNEVRQIHYFSGLLTGQEAAKEIRLFGLGQYFLQRYESLFQQFRERLGRMRKVHWVYNSLLNVVSGLAGLLGYVYLVLLTLTGQLSLGQLTFYQNLLGQFHNSLSTLISQFAALYEGSLFVNQLFDFQKLAPALPELPVGTGRPPPVPLRQGITFRNVEFGYSPRIDPCHTRASSSSDEVAAEEAEMTPVNTPSNEKEKANASLEPKGEEMILKGVNFTIEAGQTVALVGENGTGKSTLIKLLTRLYDPCGGIIEVDGVDLREYELDQWRAQIAVILQDFGRYHLMVRENIGLGQLNRLEDIARIKRAAAEGGALELIGRLPFGLETSLGRWLNWSTVPASQKPKKPGLRWGADSVEQESESGGAELSGGEWQKIALSRAFMRAGELVALPGEWDEAGTEAGADKFLPGYSQTDQAQILIMDEPSAALDARSEAALFERLWELSRGKTTLIISHRLSNLKRADKIIVLKGGQVIEQGRHAELLALGGEYARLYKLQAEAYQS